MPNLVDLSTSNDIGIGGDKAFAELGYNASLGLKFCHGMVINLGFEAEGHAGFRPDIGKYMEAIAEVEAGASATARIALQLSPNVLEEVGLFLSANVSAKAFVRGRVAAGLRFEQIAASLQDNVGELEFAIIDAFLQDAVLEVGAEALAQLAFAARAEVIAQGRLIPTGVKDAGFDFRVGAGAAFIKGLEYDVYIRSRFPEPDVFLGRVADILAEAMSDALQDDSDTPIERIAKNLTVKSVGTGLRVVASLTGSRRNFGLEAEETLAAFSMFLAEEVLGALVDELAKIIDQQINDLLARNEVDPEIITAQDRLRRIDFVGSPDDAIEELMTVLHALLDEDTARALRAVVVVVVAVSVLAGNQGAKKFEFDLKTQEDLRSWIGKKIDRFKNQALAKEVLANGGAETVLALINDDLPAPLKAVLDALDQAGIRLGVLIVALLDDGAEARELSAQAALAILASLFEREVIPRVEALLPDGGWTQDYRETVLRPAIFGVSRVLVPSLGFYIDGSSRDKAELEKIKSASAHIAYSMIGRSALFVADKALSQSVTDFTKRVDALLQKLQRRQFDQFIEGFVARIEEDVETALGFDVISDQERVLITSETRILIESCLLAARQSLGADTWTAARREAIFDGLAAVLLNPDGQSVDYENMSLANLDAALNQLSDCSFLPSLSNMSEIHAMQTAASDISRAQVQAYLFTMPSAFGRYVISVLEIVLGKLLTAIAEWIEETWDELVAGINDAIERIQAVIDDIEHKLKDLRGAIETQLDVYFDELEAYIDAYFDFLDSKIDLNDLGWLEFFDFFFDLLFGSSDEEKAKAALKDLRKQAKEDLKSVTRRSWLKSQVSTGQLNAEGLRGWESRNIFSTSITQKIDQIAFDLPSGSGSAREAAAHAARGTLGRSGDALVETASDIRFREFLRSTEEAVMQESLTAKATAERIIAASDSVAQFRITSPTNARMDPDVTRTNMPVYGPEVYFECEFATDPFDASDHTFDPTTGASVRPTLNADFFRDDDPVASFESTPDAGLAKKVLQYNFASRINLRENGSFMTPDRLERILNTADLLLDEVGFDLRILLNGRSIDPTRLKARGNRLSGYFDRACLVQGRNDLAVSFISRGAGRITRSITFYCDLKSRRHPSNVLYIDPKHTIFDTKGDDHDDARGTRLSDKERIVISHSTDQTYGMAGYMLEDARHHCLRLGSAKLKPGDSYTIYIGRGPRGSREQFWIEDQGYGIYALLNNEGECLRLRDSDGMIVSQLFFGSAAANPDINVLEVQS